MLFGKITALLTVLIIIAVVVFILLFNKKRLFCSKVTPKNQFLPIMDFHQYILSFGVMKNLTYDLSTQMKLDTLELLKLLGRGEFGEVYLGTVLINKFKKTFRTKVAVKLLKCNDEKQSVNFLLEKNIMDEMGSHRNVIVYYGFIDLKDQIAIVMEYAANGNLLNLLKRNQFPIKLNENVLCQFAIDIACGMDYLASINLIHRDLAARNVLVSKNWILKIADFGLTRQANNYYRQNNESKVPVRWLAVECLMFKKYSTMSDIWAFGILLWEIFSLGQTPYPDITDINELSLKVIQGKRNKRPLFCNSRIFNIMEETWSEIPTERPSFMNIIIELEDILMTCSYELKQYNYDDIL